MATETPDTDSLSLDTLEIVSGPHYQQHGYPHPEWTYLRRNAPVYWYDRPNVDPFCAITKHADIVQIARQPKIFLNGPRLLVTTKDQYIEGGDMLFRCGPRCRTCAKRLPTRSRPSTCEDRHAIADA